MTERKDKRLSISKLSIKDLGVTIDLPYFTRLSNNLELRRRPMPIYKNQLLTQHATTRYKIGSAAILLKEMEKQVDFYKSWGNDVQGDFERTIKQAYDFQKALEYFFIFCWGSITSTMREIWIIYALRLPREEVSFYRVKESLKIELPEVKITTGLQEVNDSEWFKYLNGARNRVEHGQIPLSQYRSKEKQLYLADNQNVEAGTETYEKNYHPLKWPSDILEETRKLIEYCSYEMNLLIYEF